MKKLVCVLSECDKPSERFTLCREHREAHGIRVVWPHLQAAEERRLRLERRRRKEQERLKRLEEERRAEELAREGTPTGVHATNVPIDAYQISALRHAIIDRPTRRVADEINISHFTIYRLAEADPGDLINKKTADKINAWMEKQ